MIIEQIAVRITTDKHSYVIVNEGTNNNQSWFICLNLRLEHDFHFYCCCEHKKLDESFSYHYNKGFDTLKEALCEIKLYLKEYHGYTLDLNDFL